MIEKENLNSLFDQLNGSLNKLKEHRKIVIYGGAALIALNHIARATVDIDVFAPRLDEVFKKVIKEVGEKNQFNEHWINSTGKAFVKELPKGWQNRTFEIYKGSNLTVLSLGRIDLIFSKLLAELDRAEDLEDVKGLKPSISELDIVAEPLMALENNQAWKKKVSELISILKRIKSNG